MAKLIAKSRCGTQRRLFATARAAEEPAPAGFVLPKLPYGYKDLAPSIDEGEGSRSRVGCANDRPCKSTRYLLYEIALALEPPTVVRPRHVATQPPRRAPSSP